MAKVLDSIKWLVLIAPLIIKLAKEAIEAVQEIAEGGGWGAEKKQAVMEAIGAALDLFPEAPKDLALRLADSIIETFVGLGKLTGKLKVAEEAGKQ